MKKEKKATPLLIFSGQEKPFEVLSDEKTKILKLNSNIRTLVFIRNKLWLEEPDILFLEDINDTSRIEFYERHLGKFIERFNLKTKIIYVLPEGHQLEMKEKLFKISGAYLPSRDSDKSFENLKNLKS